MPKSVAEIKLFNKGIVSTPDAKDIPTDASDYSLNVEPLSSDGKIRGRKTEVYATALGGFSLQSQSGVSTVVVGFYAAPAGGGGQGGG